MVLVIHIHTTLLKIMNTSKIQIGFQKMKIIYSLIINNNNLDEFDKLSLDNLKIHDFDLDNKDINNIKTENNTLIDLDINLNENLEEIYSKKEAKNNNENNIDCLSECESNSECES